MKRLFSNWKKILPVIGLAVFAGLIWKIHPLKIWSAVTQIRWPDLILLPFAIIGVFTLQTMKWRAILFRQGLIVPFSKLFRIQMIGLFYGTITPGRAGGLIKMSYLSDTAKISMIASSSSVLLDRFLDGLALFALALCGTYMLIERLRDLFLALVISLVLASLFFIMFYNMKNSKFVFDRICSPFFPERLKQRFHAGFNEFFKSLPKKKRNLAVPLGLTLITWVLMFSQNYIIGQALGIQLGFLPFIFLAAIGSTIGLLPLTVGGLGTREATLVLLFSFYGISPEKVISMSIISLIVCSFAPALVGWFFSIRN